MLKLNGSSTETSRSGWVTRRQPQGAKSAQRVRDLLRVGREVFAELGFERATTTEIAQRLGVSEATVFTYFPSKRALCLRVIEDWYEDVTAAQRSALSLLPSSSSIHDELSLIVRMHWHLFLLDGRGMCALVLSEGRTRGLEDPTWARSFAQLQRRYTAPLMDVLARGQAQGVIRTDLPLRALRPLILGPMEHGLWDCVLNQRKVDAMASAAELMSLVWPALRVAEAPGDALKVLHQELAAMAARAARAAA